jgi:hypothetical protein
LPRAILDAVNLDEHGLRRMASVRGCSDSGNPDIFKMRQGER